MYTDASTAAVPAMTGTFLADSSCRSIDTGRPADWARLRPGARIREDAGVTADLIDRARGGDGEAFGQLIAPYERELRVHCSRILGSVQDAEDALQDALVAAWQGLPGYEGRASVRTWLYGSPPPAALTRCDPRGGARG